MKTCSKCRTEQPLAEFWAGQSRCKQCAKESTAEWKRLNAERYKRTRKEWCVANASRQRELRREYNERNRARIAERRRIEWGALKRRVYEALGGVCRRCGFSDPRALQIDHVNGGGKAELKKYSGGSRTYLKKVCAAPPGEYQILCANCNWIKRHENGECAIRVPR